MAGGAVFKLGSFGNFSIRKKGTVGHRVAEPQRGFTPVMGGCGVRRHDCALERRDMSRRGKAATCRRTPNVEPA